MSKRRSKWPSTQRVDFIQFQPNVHWCLLMRRSKMAPIRQLYWSFTNAIIAFSYLPFKGMSMSTVGTMRTKDGFMLTGSSSSLKATTSFDLSAHNIQNDLSSNNDGLSGKTTLVLNFPVVLKSVVLTPTKMTPWASQVSVKIKGTSNVQCTVCFK